MAWHVPFWNWLAHAAVGALVVLAAGCLAAACCRQPVRRLRLIELTLLGCLLVLKSPAFAQEASELSFTPHDAYVSFQTAAPRPSPYAQGRPGVFESELFRNVQRSAGPPLAETYG